MSADPMTALRAYLLDGVGLAAAVSDRVFAMELPSSEAGSMPRACLVVSPSGGVPSASDLPIDRMRVDVRSYGETPAEARDVALLAHARMKALSRVVVEGCLLHSATDAGGFFALRDTLPGTASGGWPLVLRSYLVLYDERDIV